MSESVVRTAIVTYFPMFIATLSLVTSIYNGYLNNKFVDLIQNNVGRVESLRTCKETIDAYFQVKLRAGHLSELGERQRASGTAVPGVETARFEAMNAVNKMGALGTYLANMQGSAARERYTHLTWELDKIVKEAPKMPPAELSKLFEPADRLFDGMNEDCIKTARQ